MEKFDYIEKTCGVKMTAEELKKYGEMGWEIASFNDNGKEGDDRYYYIFKKKISGALNS